MADPIETLMRANLLEVFNERDDAKRRAAIERTYAPDVRWTDAEGVSTGRDALEAKCVALQQQLGNLQFVAAEPVHQLPNFGYLAWHLVDADGQLCHVRFRRRADQRRRDHGPLHGAQHR